MREPVATIYEEADGYTVEVIGDKRPIRGYRVAGPNVNLRTACSRVADLATTIGAYKFVKRDGINVVASDGSRSHVDQWGEAI